MALRKRRLHEADWPGRSGTAARCRLSSLGFAGFIGLGFIGRPHAQEDTEAQDGANDHQQRKQDEYEAHGLTYARDASIVAKELSRRELLKVADQGDDERRDVDAMFSYEA